MYIPKQNAWQDEAAIFDFMQRFSFATVVTAKNNYPIATPLPFIIKKENYEIILTAHFAKANLQWKDIANTQVLVIFAEPHAYISPKHYINELNVPTWNYIAVHAYGNACIIDGEEDCLVALEDMIKIYESKYLSQWNQLPITYKLKMLNGIVVFEIVVTDLQAKKKISQNKSLIERERIIKDLSTHSHTPAQHIAEYMHADFDQSL